MSSLKEKFRNWLKKSKQLSDKTADTYVRQLMTTYRKNFTKESRYFKEYDWEVLSENLLPVLAKYYELSNKEYYMDRVTIWHALDYFSRVLQFIGTSKQLNPDRSQSVKLYFYTYEGDFYIDSVNFEDVREYALLFNSFCFRQDGYAKRLDSEKTNDFLNKIEEIIKTNKLSKISVYDSALHIVYNAPDVSRAKTALTHYCCFMYDEYKTPLYNLSTNQTISFVQKLNPSVTIKNNYEEVIPITGEHARQVRPNLQVKRETKLGYVYSVADLADIFGVDFYTAMCLMDRYGKKYKITTSKDNYYSAIETNNCLNAYHHYKDKEKKEIYSKVDYTCTGYKDNWYTREEAMKQLRIGKTAFYKHIYKKCLYIDYAENAPKYYRPEIKYLAKTIKIKNLRKKSKIFR